MRFDGIVRLLLMLVLFGVGHRHRPAIDHLDHTTLKQPGFVGGLLAAIGCPSKQFLQQRFRKSAACLALRGGLAADSPEPTSGAPGIEPDDGLLATVIGREDLSDEHPHGDHRVVNAITVIVS